MKKLNRSLSILLSFIMVGGAFATAPLTAGALEESSGFSAKVYEDHEKAFSEKPEYIEGEAVVVMKNDRSVSEIEDSVEVKELINSVSDPYDAEIAVVSDGNSTTEEIIDELRDDPDVEYVMPNRVKKLNSITDDAYSDFQWALNNTGQNGGTPGVDIDPENAWATAQSSGEECVVAILDSGVDIDHGDLSPVLWRNTYSSLPGKGCFGYDFTGTNSDGQPRDDIGHGTHVAGIIAAAANNGIGISGVNVSGVKIMALKVGDEYGDLEFSTEIKAFEYIKKAKKLGVNIVAVNCSYGDYCDEEEKEYYDDTFNELGRLGIVTCVAAGNENISVDETEDGFGGDWYYLPAASDSKYCLCVGAADNKGNCAGFSNYGKNHVDISAPGTSILSTVSENTFNPSIYTEEQRNALCWRYQDFENEIAQGDFCSDVSQTKDVKGLNVGGDMQIGVFNGESFGMGEKSLMLSAKEKAVDVYTYAVDIPFTVASSTYDYSVSYSVKSPSENCEFMLYDFSADVDPDDDEYYGALIGYGIIDGDWEVYNHRVSPKTQIDYTKSTNRLLKLIIFSKSRQTTVYIDNIGVSKQKISTSDFGKYDFSSGTSQATPHVAGAVALINNAHPGLSAMDIINTVKSSAEQREALAPYVEGGRFLDLENIDDFAVASYIPASELKLNTSALTLSAGKNYTLNASVTPENATDKNVVWSSDDPKVAAVSANGTVTAKVTGSAVISAKTSDGLSAKCKVTVIVPVTGIKLNYTALTMTAGTKYTLKATVTPSDATNKTVYWSSSNTSVAGMANGGVINAKKAGSCTITAKTNNGKTATCKITVKKAPAPSGIKLNTNTLTMTAGTKYTLKATISPSTANNKTVYWSSSNTAVAGMAAGGVVNAKKAGSCIITAKTANGIKTTCKLTVKAKTNAVFVSGIKLNTSTLLISAGTKYTLKATVTPSNATNKTVYWSSSDPTVAGMAAGGVVNAKKAGTCTVTAKTANGKTAVCKVRVIESAQTYINNFNKLKSYINKNGYDDGYEKYIERTSTDGTTSTSISVLSGGGLSLYQTVYTKTGYSAVEVTWNLNKSDTVNVDVSGLTMIGDADYEEDYADAIFNVKTYSGSNAPFKTSAAYATAKLNDALNSLDAISREVVGVSVQNLGFATYR